MKLFSLGKGIRDKRKELGLTIEGLANKIGVSRRYLSQIELHDRVPSPSVFKEIEKTLKLGPNFQKQYIQKKYSDFGEVLRGVIAEDKTKHTKLYFAKGQESLVKYLKEKSPATYNALTTPTGSINVDELLKELSGCADTYPIAVSFVKQYYPSHAGNKAFISKIADRLKKLKKKMKTSWEDIQDDLKNLTPSPA